MTTTAYLAARMLLRSPFTTGLLILAVAAGLMFQIPNVANLEGYSRELIRHGATRHVGHVVIYSDRDQPFSQAQALAQRLRAHPGVKGVAVRLKQAGLVSRHDQPLEAHAGSRQAPLPAPVVGYDPAQEPLASSLCQGLFKGRCPGPDDPPAVLLGSRLGIELAAEVGTPITLHLPVPDGDTLKVISQPYRVSGILSGTGGFSVDNTAFMPILELYRLLKVTDEATSLAVYLHSPAQAPSMAAQLSPRLPDQKVVPWQEASPFVAKAVATNRLLTRISMLMAMFAVAIPVLALLHVSVLHERRQIAMLAAMGFPRAALLQIYLLKSCLISLVGTGLGTGLGLALCLFFKHFPLYADEGFVIRPLITLPGVLIPALVLALVVLLASLPAAMRAAGANPTLELREES